jgi:hypothetical protein
MCWALYMASDSEIPLVPWDDQAPAFNVTLLSETEAVVRKQFSLRNVAYVGSHEGCGCGFHFHEEIGLNEQAGELKSLNELASYLTHVLQGGAIVELFFCWEGDQGAEVVSRLDLQPDSFIGGEFPMSLLQLAHVRLASDKQSG